MHIRYTICSVLLLLGHGAPARSAGELETIKQRYDQASQLEKEPGAQHLVSFHTMLPAVGLQETQVRFVFISEQAHPERDPYELKHELVKVGVQYNVAASAQFRIEYLYDSRGELVFFFEEEESAEGSRASRIYYRAGKPFRRIQDSRSGDGKPSREVTEKLTPGQRRKAKEALARARQYREHFRQLLALEQLK
ncbi:MAG: hypothetical protein JXR96_23995 [Deltaproteobacteria bacterium]|nr:hypothetical protein [Deltaproteobacteria bacterium]